MDAGHGGEGDDSGSDDDDDDDENMDDDDEEEEDDMEPEDLGAAGATEAALARVTRGQKKEGTGADAVKAAYARNKVLYGAEGQLNPNQARAAKKKAKRVKAATARSGGGGGDDGGDESGSDFEWEDDAA